MSKQLLQALIEQPSSYIIDVNDNSMLPKNLKDKKTLRFEVKPPSTGTLSRGALILSDIPEELFKPKEEISTESILPYIDLIIDYMCVIMWGKKTNHPGWYNSFIKENTEPKEVFQIFHETSLKCQTGFFLNSFQIARLTNPMITK